MRVYVLIVALLLAPGGAEAGLRSFCENLFARMQPKAFTTEEEARFARALEGLALPDLLRVRRTDDPMLWLSLDKLPDEVVEVLRRLPKDLKQSNMILNNLDRMMDPKDGSVFRTIQRVWRDHPDSNWIDQGRARWRKMKADEPAAALRIEDDWRSLSSLIHARNLWSRGAGEVALPLRESGGKTWIRVGEEEFPAKPYQGGWAIEVPKSRVSHPAWNPLESKKLTAIAQKGVPPPKVYETMLGHDGQFYLLDGNHRFEFDSRTIVKVRIPDPPTTGSLRLWFDVINHPQPDDELILRYAEGRAGWRDMMDSQRATRVILPPLR